MYSGDSGSFGTPRHELYRLDRVLAQLTRPAMPGADVPAAVRDQLRALGLGLEIVPIRGNIDTRMRKVTDGELDGNRHPGVVLLLMEVDGQPAFRCSGTLLSPTVLLTAGHCAGEPGEFSGMRVFTESDVDNGNNNYPFAGPNSVEAVAWSAHPLFTEAQFFLHDVGVVVLQSPGVKLTRGSYGVLPAENDLEGLQPRASTIFTFIASPAP